MIALLFTLGSCNAFNDDDNHDIVLYTSIYPIQFIVEELVGNEASVVSVYPPGVDAHSYEPTIREMLNIARGKAFIYLGAGMESFAESAKSTLKASDVHFIEVAEHKEIFLHGDDHDHHADHSHFHTDIDPHIWFDPLRMIEASKYIKNQLSDIFPHLTNTLDENFFTLKKRLLELDKQYEATLRPKTNRHIVVSHAAYQYWEERYQIVQIPISGLTAGDEPSQKDLANIVLFAEEENIQYVLFEQNATNKIATIIQEHIGAEPLFIHNLEVLVDEDIRNKEDYFTLMKTNLTILDQATK